MVGSSRHTVGHHNLLEGDSTEADKHRPSAAKRGYDRKWRKSREEFLKDNPKCSKCGGKAVHAHHKHRKRKGGHNGKSNLEALCQSCHSAVTNKTDKKKESRPIGKFASLVEELVPLFTGLSLPREVLPQIPAALLAEFFNRLHHLGVATREQWVPSASLMPTQSHIDTDKIGPSRARVDKPIVVSKDYYIMDGHHGWASMAGQSVRCVVVDLPIEELLGFAWEFESGLEDGND